MTISPKFEARIGGKTITIDREKCRWPRFSDAEYDRRHDLIRNFMREKELDCLLIGGGETHYGKGWTNFRWVSNYYDYAAYAYVVFPLEGDPTICCWFNNPHDLAASVIDDVRAEYDTSKIAVNRIKELGLEKGKIAVIEHCTSTPREHYETFLKELPGAKFQFIFEDFMRIRWQKSAEEIERLEIAGELGDLAIKAIATKLRPGMKEYDLFSIAYNSVLSNGGEPRLMLLASDSMRDPIRAPSVHIQDIRPMPRTIQSGDVIVQEIGPCYDGYECQTGKPITMGEPTDIYKEMFDIALKVYHKATDQFRTGRGDSEVKKALMNDSELAGIIEQERLLLIFHGMHGVTPHDGPVYSIGPVYMLAGGELPHLFHPISLKPNTSHTIEIWVRTPDLRGSLFLAESLLVTDDAPRRLNKYPLQLTTI